jgi:hypothetical protein
LIAPRERGEHAPDALSVLDHVLAPMYIRVLFGIDQLTADYVNGLVNRLLWPQSGPPEAEHEAAVPGRGAKAR